MASVLSYVDHGVGPVTVSSDAALNVRIVNDESDALYVMIPKSSREDVQHQLNMMKADIRRLKEEVVR